MRALIDCDILCYEIGSAIDPEGYPLDWPLVRYRLNERLTNILEAVGADSWQGYLTVPDRSNFRYEVATIKPYKEHRKKKEKPFWYEAVYNFLLYHRNCVEISGKEADDAISIEQWSNLNDVVRKYGPEGIRKHADTIICTRDKDLKIVPGWHYRWPGYFQDAQPPYWITPLEGLRFFYKQLLTGDDADNIPGIYTIGPKSAHLKKLDKCETELEMFKVVSHLYSKYFGSYWKLFLTENGRLLWMMRKEDDYWTIPHDWEKYVDEADDE